ncbi:LysR family transcriptional regulator [Xinfangfangia sp. D13-10-4-6]|uniref:LysR family transcriptional regulator n=1 Tax=Pseudogemmobacter hezensis TaxID=2737662 RepID=UPI001551B644|nr:LysR substrate-binding domain-containing protein [Pseudogemmobacter hezensis]NPD17024.1 LysR family transcriptional regulator [Pseudogemmobacter hezensis]
MDIRQLRYFVAIAEQGSMTRAASFLHVAQPALSLHLRNMEEELGAALLYRSSRGVSLTEAGHILLRNARVIINQLALVEDEIRGQESDPAGEVRLGLPGTISQILAVPLITAAHKRFPKIKLQVSDAMSGFVLSWIREGTVDLAVLYGKDESHGIRTQKLIEEELQLLGPTKGEFEGQPASADGSVRFADALELPLILPSKGHGLRDQLIRTADMLDLDLNTTIDVDSYSNIKRLVEEGLGFSILPKNAIAAEVADGRLRCHSFCEPPVRRSVYLAHSLERPMTNAVKAIHSVTRDTLRKLARDGSWVGVEVIEDQDQRL